MAPNDRELELLGLYRSQPASIRRTMAAKASPRLRGLLARIERDIAMNASSGALAAVLTDRREMQPRHRP